MALLAMTTQHAIAQDIESLVMPGEVIEGHADLETECSSCHKMFDKKGQRQLCMDCHEDVALDVSSKTGFHGKHEEAGEAQCASCHTDHEGRAANIVNLDLSSFDHAFTDFELTGSHIEAECDQCHSDDRKHRDAPQDCVDCHREDDPHGEAMGDVCSDCHSPTDWQDTSFDHDTTGYPLIGRHAETACLDCHDNETYRNAPTECIDCHAEDDAHDGRSGQECENCHNPTDWKDTSFNHARDTEFALEGRHAQLTCGDCHSEDPFDDEMDRACVACHVEDDNHDGHNGEQCDSCHSNENWTEPTFDHDVDTDYRLVGGHIDVSFNDCHVEPVFEVELNASCDSCHLDDDPHEETLGTQCENCHTEFNWEDPLFFDHDLTRFPLLGSHEQQECEDCHKTKAFSEAEAKCVSCHREDDPHKGYFPVECSTCHNPVAWELWLFNHDAQTDFQLDGAHVEVACEDCHRTPLQKIKAIDGSCRNCHRPDDIHDGEFGSDCGRCHSSDTFTEVRSLQ